MHTEPHTEVHHHKNGHKVEKFEHLLGILMVVAGVLLAVGLIYGFMNGDSTPSYLR